MKENRWKIVSEILLDSLDLPVRERPAYLDSLGLDGDLRKEVEGLLASEDGVETLMNLSAVELSSGYFDDSNEEIAVAGQTIGAYEVIREIGSGGMGAVYLAKRADGSFEQRVALKLLRREMNSPALRRRFKKERQILASLEHEKIARLVDAGSTEQGAPFIAMEYVEGLPINEYCERNGLSIGDRLDIFQEVCLAVDFAHRNLVVHRDLKPSNILVNEHGTPKLLDFGISKLMSDEIESVELATVTQLGVMTPGYASPEQIERRSVTTATDVYSLGVILYELLCGHRPFEEKEGDFKEIYKAIIESDPPLPSSLVTLTPRQDLLAANTATDTAVLRQPGSVVEATVDQLAERHNSKTKRSMPPRTGRGTINLSSSGIRGDLDNITLKALRKEPERRYSSAEKLAEDIRNHLRGLPVTARPNTFSYRAEKFVKRNKASVVAASLIVLAIVAGIVATLWQARVAQAERAKAERRFNDVRSLANSFLFSLGPKIEKLPGSTPAREEMVALALGYLDSLSQDAGDDLELQAELATAYEKVGDVQGNPSNPNVGDIAGSLASYEKALKIRAKLVEAQPGDPAQVSALAQNYKVFGEINANGGDLPKGKEYLEKALELRERIVQSDPLGYDGRLDLAATLVSLGDVSFDDFDNKKAIEFYSRAKDIYEGLLRERPGDYQTGRLYANSYIAIGKAHGWDNDLKSGEENLDKGLAILSEMGDRYPNDQAIQRSLVIAYLRTGDNYADFDKEKQGVELFEKGIDVAQRLSTADPQSVQAKRDLAIITRKLAELLSRLGQNDRSLEKMDSVFALFKELCEKDPNNSVAVYDLANAQFAAGGTYLKMKDYRGGIQILKEAETGFRKVLSIESEDKQASRTLAFTLINIATHYTKLADPRNRGEYLPKALDYKKQGLEILYKQKREGKLSEYDDKYVLEAENELRDIQLKLAA